MTAHVGEFLREREALIARADAGPDAARALSDLADRAVSALAETALSSLRRPWAVLALGGWGARRLLPRSDLDLLVVTDEPAGRLAPAVSDVLYPLWDAGLDVGHQVRTRRDHLRATSEDPQTLTATLTGRWLAGDAALAERVLRDVAADASRRAANVVRELVTRPREGSPYLLEPDLKNGAGGQRDLDEIVWLGSVLAGRPYPDPGGAVAVGLIDDGEARLLARASALITAARWTLHANSARPSALLTLEDAADSNLDLEAVQAALADTHHTLLRVRGRMAGSPTAFDPLSAGARAPVDARLLFALLDRGESGLADLEEAAWSGALNDLVPAFGELMTLRRPALSHLYTVGDHSLRAAALLRPDAGSALRVATILHDAGKAQSGPGHAERGASAVLTLAKRFGLSDAETADAALLVREHLLLSETATGADIHDEDVLLRAAARVPGVHLVDALAELTRADASATGPGVWSEWRATIVGELADRLRAALSEDVTGAGIAEAAERTRRDAADGLAPAEREGAPGAFVRRASLRYLAATAPAGVVAHARLVTRVAAAAGAEPFAVAVAPGTSPGTWTVSVGAAERPGLFAAVCGALSLSGLDILAADAFDASPGIALDVFAVRSDTRALVSTDTWAAFERHLRSALKDPAGLAVRLAERRRHYPAKRTVRTTVEIGETGAYATAVRVRAADRIGLLYDVARAIADTDLEIRWARATTRDGLADDVFHVTDSLREPVGDPGVLGHLSMRIRERVATGA